MSPVTVCGEQDELSGLRRVQLTEPGIGRVRRGRGFQYRTADGVSVTDRRELARLRALAVPPAWTDVWICTDVDGHIQAVGTDAAGRRQYLYHDRWREARDRAKFDRVLRLASRLPTVREEVAGSLAAGGLGRDRVLAGALRMMELGAFRVGGTSTPRTRRTTRAVSASRPCGLSMCAGRAARSGSVIRPRAARGATSRCVTASCTGWSERCCAEAAPRRSRTCWLP
jgi:DNA topoisomerase IB